MGQLAQGQGTGLDGSTPLHRFQTFLQDLASVTCNVYQAMGPEDSQQSEFEVATLLSVEQQRVTELLEGIDT